MKEKELRLAVILTGGISLSVHMHGVSKELLKLVRASKIYHTIPGAQRQLTSYKHANDDDGRETDTEEIYFELLQEIGKYVDLRIFIDVIAGSSAGGVNGIYLSHALVHDCAIDDHRKMWLEHADVLQLMDKETVAGPWSKLYVEAVMRLFFWRTLKQLAPEPETNSKLRTFLRSRWFSPPFSSSNICSWLITAFKTMDKFSKKGEAHTSLLPYGHELSLCISVTDYEGYKRRLEINDPAEINEKAHRHILTFTHKQQREGSGETDFTTEGIPALVFAARATSSVPGAFPPVSIGEIETYCKNAGLSWPGKKDFLRDKLNIKDGIDPQHCYIDGSVVMDKPFAAAINALSEKTAHREVIRRILYVNPVPPKVDNHMPGKQPDMFRTILAASVEIPGNEPIGDDLAHVQKLNRQIRLLSDVVAEARPRVSSLVLSVMEEDGDAPSIAQFRAWRQRAHEAAAAQSGISYESYLQLKTLEVMSDVERLIIDFSALTGVNIIRNDLNKALNDWLARQTPPRTKKGKRLSQEDQQKWRKIGVLRKYDINFRIRRLRFVIRRLNELYRLSHAETLSGNDPLDELKSSFFEQIEDLRRGHNAKTYSTQAVAAAKAFQKELAAKGDQVTVKLDALMDIIADEMKQENINTKTDETFSVMVLNYLGPQARKELNVAYLGFSFFDVLTYPMLRSGEFSELEEILIDRISPVDAQSFRRGGTEAKLKGARMRRFGGFFNRDYRENDYIWGRLIGAERMVDIVLSALGDYVPTENIDRKAIKLRLFEKILTSEEPHLKSDPDMIKKLFAELEALKA